MCVSVTHKIEAASHPLGTSSVWRSWDPDLLGAIKPCHVKRTRPGAKDNSAMWTLGASEGSVRVWSVELKQRVNERM